MKSDTIKTPFSATVRGRVQCRAALGSLSEHINDADFIMLFVNEGCYESCDHDDGRCPVVLGIIVTDPDRFADHIAAAVHGERLGFGPGQPAMTQRYEYAIVQALREAAEAALTLLVRVSTNAPVWPPDAADVACRLQNALAALSDADGVRWYSCDACGNRVPFSTTVHLTAAQTPLGFEEGRFCRRCLRRADDLAEAKHEDHVCEGPHCCDPGDSRWPK